MKRKSGMVWLPLVCLFAIVTMAGGELSASTKSSASSSSVKKTQPAKKAAVAPKKSSTVKKATPAKKKVSKKKAPAKKKAVAKTRPAEVPVEQPEIPQEIIEALASGDVNDAIILMRDEKPNPKLLYLTREATRIASFRMSKKPKRSEAHKFYQNAAISNHNLYLFLKTKGIDQPQFYKDAMSLYKKARGAATLLHKAECDLLQAALMASSGEKAKAEKKYMKIDDRALRGDFPSMEYLAAYHAAMGNIEGTIAALDAAHRLNPDATLTWIAVGDDFSEVAGHHQFQSLMTTWKAREASKNLMLSLPKAEKPRLQVGDDSGLFRPQKSMPHYKLKKAPPKKKTASVKKSAGKKSSTKKAAPAKKSQPASTVKKK